MTSGKVYVSSNEEETRGIAKEFSLRCVSPCVVLLNGELGSGKTTFVRGFAEGLGIFENIVSPSYTYLRTYPLKRFKGTLYHFDLYLLSEKKGDTSSLFFDESLEDPCGIVVVEWAQFLPLKPPESIEVDFIATTPCERKIVFRQVDSNKKV